MQIYRRAIPGAGAGLFAAGLVAASFFVLDLIRLQPFATPGALSGAFPGPAGYAWDFTSLSGLVAVVGAAFQIATFTLLHFLAFSMAGVLVSFFFDGKNLAGLKPLLAATALCTAAFYGTVAASSSLVAVRSVGPVVVVSVNFFAAILMVGYLRLAAMPEPEDEPAGGLSLE